MKTVFGVVLHLLTAAIMRNISHWVDFYACVRITMMYVICTIHLIWAFHEWCCELTEYKINVHSFSREREKIIDEENGSKFEILPKKIKVHDYKIDKSYKDELNWKETGYLRKLFLFQSIFWDFVRCFSSMIQNLSFDIQFFFHNLSVHSKNTYSYLRFGWSSTL